MNVLTDIIDRSRTGESRKEDGYFIGSYKGTLDSDTKSILDAIYDFAAFAPFNPSSILWNQGDVKVLLDDKKTKIVEVSSEELITSLRSLNEELESLNKFLKGSQEINQEELLGLNKRKDNLINKIQKINEIKNDGPSVAGKDNYTIEIELLGYYISPKKEIHLMMGTLGGNYMLTAIVFVHELMHAFFDWYAQNDICSIYSPEIEESLAEYGMLCFVEMFERIHVKYKGILDMAKKHVQDKEFVPGICHYAYGYYLYCDKSNFCVDWVSLYHRYRPTLNIDSAELKSYKSKVSPIQYPQHERSCEELLYAILKPRRFVCDVKASYYSYPQKQEIYVYLTIDEDEIADFRSSYLISHNEIMISFENLHGLSIVGEASMYKEKTLRKPRIRLSNQLLEQYVDFFAGVHEKQFRLYESIPSDGDSPAEWVAKEL